MVNPDPAKPQDSSPEGAADDESQLDRVAPVAGNVTGRVKFDDRGNAVWEWAVSTGSFGAEASNKRLRKLENASLTISDDGAPPRDPPRTPTPGTYRPAAAPATPAAAPLKENRKGVTLGYSPYDSGLLVKAAEQRPKKKDLRRLSEWLKLRDQASRNKKDQD
jgi:hypothetical protein